MHSTYYIDIEEKFPSDAFKVVVPSEMTSLKLYTGMKQILLHTFYLIICSPLFSIAF